MSLFRRLLEMVRFSHTIFALPFALISATLAWMYEPFRIVDLLGILVCMVSARSAAMSFNRIVDRKWDALNPRTENRHLPAGTLSLRTVSLFCAGSAGVFLAATLLFYLREPSNPWPLILAGPVLLFICAYSLTKRFTALCHLWLGASLMLTPLAAWIAIRGMADLQTPFMLGLAVLFWVTGFDILYASQDADFDKKARLSSLPARVGLRTALRVAAISHLLMICVLVALYFLEPQLREVYFVGVILVSGLIVYEHSIISPTDLSRVNRAFFQVNGFVSIGLFLVVLAQVLIG